MGQGLQVPYEVQSALRQHEEDKDKESLFKDRGLRSIHLGQKRS